MEEQKEVIVINGEKPSIRNIRKVNQENLLRSIIARRQTTRSELAKETDVSLMTVKSILDDLIREGVLRETLCDNETGLGRKPKSLSLAASIGAIVCISLTSKDFFSYHLYNIYAELLEERQVRVDEQIGYRENLARLTGQILADVERTGLRLLGAGVSVPGAYYEENDTVNYDLIPGFEHLPLKGFFTAGLGTATVEIIHDVFAGARAEFNAAKPREDSLFYFYVGDGVGGAFIQDDNTWLAGENLLAGEIGQFVVWDGAANGILEAHISTPNLLRQIRKTHKNITFHTALRLYDEGDETARAVIGKAAGLAAHSLHNVAWVLNPGRIVITSSHPRYAQILLEAAAEFNRRFEGLPIPMQVDLLAPKLPQNGEMLGCFSLVLTKWIDGLML